MRIRVVGLIKLDDASFALIEFLLQPISGLARTIRPQFNGVDGDTIVRSVTHAVHHLCLVNHVAGSFHHATANNTHALKHAATLRHLLNAEYASLAVVTRSQCSNRPRKTAAAYQDVGFLGANNFIFRDGAHLERNIALTHDAAFDIDHGHVARFYWKRVGVQAFIKIAATALVFDGHATLGIVARTASEAQCPTSSRSTNKAQSCCAHKTAAGKPFSPFCQCSSLNQLSVTRLHSTTTPLPSRAKHAPTALTNPQYKAVHSTALRQDVS